MNAYNMSLLCRLIDCTNISAEERKHIVKALKESEDNKKRVGFWIRHTAETNYTTYVCSNCGNMLIPEKLEDEFLKPCRYKSIYIQAHRYCHICGYKMEGVKNYAYMKEWAEKFD